MASENSPLIGCFIFSSYPDDLKDLFLQRSDFKDTNSLVKDGIQFQAVSQKVNEKLNSIDFGILIEDNIASILDFIKRVYETEEIKVWLICQEINAASILISILNVKPVIIGLDFHLHPSPVTETIKLYDSIKNKWQDVPVIGITQYEGSYDNVHIELKNKMRFNKDSVYNKGEISVALPNIIRDKVLISKLNSDIEKIKIEVNKKEQIIEDIEAKSKADYVQLYFNRSINIQSIEAVNPAEVYRKYNLVSGNSFAVKCLLFKAIANAKTDDPLIVEGPCGSGKDIIPRIIHDCSKRKNSNKYEVYDCTKAKAADHKVIITELFGAIKGFVHGTDAQPGVFKRNNGGTVFIDELHYLPLEVQAMLLRLLENEEITPLGGTPEKVDVRIIAGTNKDINQLVSEGKLLSDLYSRLCRDIINVPTLAQRGKKEIILIAKSYLQKYCDQNGITYKKISDEAIRKLSEYSYSNFNIRELEGVIGNAVKFVTDDHITDDDIVFDLPEFTTSELMSQDIKNQSNNNATKSFQMNRSKDWLWCIINAIEKIKGKSNISSRDLIGVFVSPSNGTYSSDASFSPALKEHIENILLLLETPEFEEHKENVLKLSVIRWAYQKKSMNKNKG